MPGKRKQEVAAVTRCSVFFDFSLVHASESSPPTGELISHLEFDLCVGEKCPKATENFRQLIAGAVQVGEKRNARQATYKGTRLLRCTSEAVQGGDTANSPDGKCQDTIFGALIEDEAFAAVPHTFGTLSLCNSGKNSNGSQFFIVSSEEQEQFPHLDSRHVSLGFLKGGEDGKNQLRKLHELAVSMVVDRTGKLPKPDSSHIIISDCGVLPE